MTLGGPDSEYAGVTRIRHLAPRAFGVHLPRLIILATAMAAGCSLKFNGKPLFGEESATPGGENKTAAATTPDAASEALPDLDEPTAQKWRRLETNWDRLAPRLDSEPEVVARAVKVCLDAEAIRTEAPSLGPHAQRIQQDACKASLTRVPDCWPKWTKTAAEYRNPEVLSRHCGTVGQHKEAMSIAEQRGLVDGGVVTRARAALARDIRDDELAAKLRPIDTAGSGTCEALSALLAIYRDDLSDEERASVDGLVTAEREAILMGTAQTPGGALGQLGREIGRIRSNLYIHATSSNNAAVQNRNPDKADDSAAEMACLGDYLDAPKRAEIASANAKRIRAELEEEAKCRADPKCRAQWVAEDICRLVEMRKDTVAMIAEEKRYARKVGVLNLSELQMLKEDLQSTDARIGELKIEYKTLNGSAFSSRLCQ